MGEEVKAVIPESLLKKKKKKRNEEWELAKKQDLEAAKKKKVENRKLIYSRAKQYAKEYDAQEKELIQLKQEAKLKGGFYVDPEAKLLFIIRILVSMPCTQGREILQLLRLRQLLSQITLSQGYLLHKLNGFFSQLVPYPNCLQLPQIHYLFQNLLHKIHIYFGVDELRLPLSLYSNFFYLFFNDYDEHEILYLLTKYIYNDNTYMVA
ncbi:hypothetical protein CRYUN_Cryun26dG0085400 [Craigia yunnanensis]